MAAKLGKGDVCFSHEGGVISAVVPDHHERRTGVSPSLGEGDDRGGEKSRLHETLPEKRQKGGNYKRTFLQSQSFRDGL